ncbi:hypothetical protein EHV15_05320 [Paenibacillus oralis]|uniref:Uncharacterized protein n=1 Tax=Paenibacillus oralis TaxID=2490856 RepID=A0A3P3TWC6_9BACL|nr:hypothetical protein [Paenibacillus oralis]RRJ62435.1 hypothetical protein EHV15_05320 [Paenibacillus oralis]
MNSNRKKYEAKRQQREMKATFDSFEYLLREKLEGADQILARIDYEVSGLGVSVKMRREYVRARLIEMIADIAEKREAKKNAL